MKIAIGTDHRGFAMKEFIKKQVAIPDQEISWVDVGCNTDQACDYPEFAILVAQQVQAKQVDYGVLLCGSGIGMAIAANRFAGIFAALVWNEETARSAREHDHANVLVLPADFISPEQAVTMITAWLQASFQEGRHRKRVEQINSLGGV